MRTKPGVVLAFAAALSLCGCGSQSNASGESKAADSTSTPAQVQQIDWKALDQVMGRTGTMQAGDVYRFSMPRGDMSVTAQGVVIKPPLALGSWIAFKATSTGAIAMGDLVLKESEIAPVISRLQEAGIAQTAVHHHLLYESPRVMYVHVHGHGDAMKIAEGVKAAIALTSTPAQSTAPAAAPAAALGIDTAQITAILGHGGRVNGGVYQVSVPRAETIRDGGNEIPPSMGLSTAINFQPTGGGKAAITGDFVMIASEVDNVIRALRANRIEVTSLHNHLLNEEPRLFFMHFWANDDALTLARGLRAGLDATDSRR